MRIVVFCKFCEDWFVVFRCILAEVVFIIDWVLLCTDLWDVGRVEPVEVIDNLGREFF